MRESDGVFESGAAFIASELIRLHRAWFMAARPVIARYGSGEIRWLYWTVLPALSTYCDAAAAVCPGKAMRGNTGWGALAVMGVMPVSV